MPSTRDDFSDSTKRTLAARAGFCCSYPTCGRPTVGPSDEGVAAVSSIGMACHIVAAAGGPQARRVVPTLTPGERASADNGIWMCYTHGRLVDTDETRFSIEMLRQWRAIAELKARHL